MFSFLKKKDESNNSTNTVPIPATDNIHLNSFDENKFKEFDLNIEKILENWEVYHAIREIISNALDEQIITGTKDVEICKINDSWHIKDFGRGLNYHHLTENENQEKLNNENLIGRFGVGLKDALATLYRNNIKINITSRHGIITLKQAPKSGFEDIITLHANIEEAPDKNIIGTDFSLYGCSDEDIFKAKRLFLKFENTAILEKTAFGEVIEKTGETAFIYINGVKVSEEPNFLFSYNITSLTKQLKKALNRERTNVGRSAYSERIKTILLACVNEQIIRKLVDDLQQYNSGLRHDELAWTDVAMYASKKIGEFKQNVVFVTPSTAISQPSVIDDMKLKGYEPVVISETLINKIDDFNEDENEVDVSILTTNKFISNMAEEKSYKFISVDEMTLAERSVYSNQDNILKLIGGKPYQVKDIKVSETIYSSETFAETVGLWDPNLRMVIIKRCQLKELECFAGTLIHECIHAKSGCGDVNRTFESALTDTIGQLAKQALN
jgi:UDP-N-acetylglucosamine transferase subunit ALG13